MHHCSSRVEEIYCKAFKIIISRQKPIVTIEESSEYLNNHSIVFLWLFVWQRRKGNTVPSFIERTVAKLFKQLELYLNTTLLIPYSRLLFSSNFIGLHCSRQPERGVDNLGALNLLSKHSILGILLFVCVFLCSK